MKANELSCKDLMVGDWVRIKIIQHNTKVTNIDANSVYTESAFPIRYDEIEPIPLTAEILEKNGFRQIGEKFIWGEIDDDLIEIIPSINNSYRIKVSVADLMIGCNIWCSHVHQLQHALKLCEIEKEIIL